MTLSAQGAGSDSDLRVQGSKIDAGNNARLYAEGGIELTAAIQSTRETNSHSSKSGSIGMGFNAGGAQSGVSFSAGASRGKGQGTGEEVTHVNTQVRAGRWVVVESGNDTTLRGAVVSAPTVQASISGDLLIESLQDRATYSEHSRSASAGVSVCIPPLCYGASSISGGVGQTNIDSSNASVQAQSAIRASGAGEQSDITVRGGQVQSGGTTSLKAEGDVLLLAAQNTTQERSRQSSSSGSIGASISASGVSVNANASKGRGQGAGDGTSYSNTHIGGRTVQLESGGDTTLKGAVVSGERVTAKVGGDLKIESLQDTATFDESSRTSGFGVSLPVYGTGQAGASVSAGKTKIESDFNSVAEPSGFNAGDGGFVVDVRGHTELIGGAITSDQSAVENELNSYTTNGTLTLSDIDNTATYSAKSASVGISSGGTSGSGAGIGSDNGSTASTTTSGISGIAGDTAMRSTDAETGIQRIFDKERVQKEVQAQVVITEAFSRQASKAASSYIDAQRNELRQRLQGAESAEQKTSLLKEIDDLALQQRALNILIGAVTGLAPSAILKEGLDTAADEMRRLMIEDSNRFAGITDGATVLRNASGRSEGINGDGYKLGGTRLDLDGLCGSDNARCEKYSDGRLTLRKVCKTPRLLNRQVA